MEAFSYRDGQLFAEGVALPALAQRFGTPTYVYSAPTSKPSTGLTPMRWKACRTWSVSPSRPTRTSVS